jgi:hypothetical protein
MRHESLRLETNRREKMVNERVNSCLTVFLAVATTSCSPEQQAVTEVNDNEQARDPDARIRYICGLANAGDILSKGNTGILLALGMNGVLDGSEENGHIYMINPIDGRWSGLVVAQTILKISAEIR